MERDEVREMYTLTRLKQQEKVQYKLFSNVAWKFTKGRQRLCRQTPKEP